VGFEIAHPMDNHINTGFRAWKLDYAQVEWAWYLSQDRSVAEIKKKAKIWDSMHSGDNIVNSNYGYQWNRDDQLNKTIRKLKEDKFSRQCVLTIYDAKEIVDYEFDTPCTLSISFQIVNDRLNMTVMMRSNDLWFGFCNDQFCFSNLQDLVAKEVGISIGSYFHFAVNLHLYDQHIEKLKKGFLQ
jgi:thymidylate synthase